MKHSFQDFSSMLSRGEISVERVTRELLEKIQAEKKLDAFIFVDAKRALSVAKGIDAMVAGGTRLGPLAGLPIAVKDLYSVDGLPTNAGSRLDISDLVPPEGPFIRRLKRAGCIIVGKTRTSEFAFGGFNLTHPLPWNPCDAQVKRMTGGSSHGSAVAMAAGLCAFSLGSDTGGSVRQPAAFTGVFGYKASASRWPLEGVFPMCPQMDSLGIFTRTAADAAWVLAGIEDRPVPQPRPVRGLRLAVPRNHFLDECEPPVQETFERIVAKLSAAGAHLFDIQVPEAEQIDEFFAAMVPADVLAFLGKERFLSNKDLVDPVARQRALAALDLPAIEYLRLAHRQRELVRLTNARMVDCDAWLSPTVPTLPAPVAGFDTVDKVAAWNRRNTRNTRPANLFGQCGVSIPVRRGSDELPIGLQVVCADGRDVQLLSIAQGIEGVQT